MALSNALLGAIGAGDIGQHFPDTDPAYAGASSVELLRLVLGRVKADGYRVGNADITILAQQPKIWPYTGAMRERLATALEVEPSAVNIKAATTEELGFVGRQEGMMAEAVVLIVSIG